MNENRRGVQEGMIVYSSDGEKLGKVLQCEAETFIIEKGFFFPKDYIARYQDISDVRGDEIHLSSAKSAYTGDRDLREGSTLGAASSTGESYGTGRAAMGTERERTTAHTGGEDVRVPLAEEELDVTKRDRQTGEVRLNKEVVTEHKRIDVPVMKERVTVEHVEATDRNARPGDASFEQKSVAVPVHEEEVEIRKRPVVKEEVRVRKERQVEQRAAEADLRKERIDVEGQEHTVRDRDISDDPLKRNVSGEDETLGARRDPADRDMISGSDRRVGGEPGIMGGYTDPEKDKF
ncbi:MAG: YsnF/AvaK domain-containing protein [Anaeromyxobacteraceae bacterium]